MNRETPVGLDQPEEPRAQAAGAPIGQDWHDDPDPIEEVPSFQAVKRDLQKVPPIRLVITVLLLLLSLGIARYSWGLPVSRAYDPELKRAVLHIPARPDEREVRIPIALDAERALYDARAYQAAKRRPVDEDKRILMIAYNQETLEQTAKRSPLDRTILAKALTNIDTLGAKAIGIDILFDQPQPEDPQLMAALKAMKTPVHIAYSTSAANSGDIEYWQQEYLDAFFARLKGTNVHRASIRGAADDDNVMRQWPPLARGLPPFMPIALTGRGEFTGYEGSVLYRMPLNVERNVFAEFPIQLFAEPAVAQAFAEQVRGRIVLVGGDLPDVDRFDTPATRATDQTISGLEVLATETAQILDGRMPGRVSGTMLWVLAILVVAAGMFTAMLDVRPWVAMGAILFQLVFFSATPFLFERIGMDTYGLPAFGWLGGWALAFAATNAADRAVTSDQRRYAQSALGKYLPRDIAAQILRDPEKLSLTGEKRWLYTLFTDIEGFTSLSHVLPPERVATLLNTYLDGMSNIVLNHGGTIDKFVGDAVVAFWGAPIARADDGDRAVAAALAMTEFTANFALKDSNDGAMLGRTRVGLHYGEAVVGNFGGEGRLSYTALGDAMNCAARLEGANKHLKTIALVSQEARDRSTRTEFRPMGRIAVSGRATPMVVWEPALHMDPVERATLSRLWTEFDSGNVAALDEIEQICLTHSKDAALTLFAARIRSVGPGGTFELREK